MSSQWILLPIWAFIVCLGVMCCLTICCSCFALCCFGCFARKKDHQQPWDEENENLPQLVTGDQPMTNFRRGKSREQNAGEKGEENCEENQLNVEEENQMNNGNVGSNGNESNEVALANESSHVATYARIDGIYPRLLPSAPAMPQIPAENPPPIPSAGQKGQNADAINI